MNQNNLDQTESFIQILHFLLGANILYCGSNSFNIKRNLVTIPKQFRSKKYSDSNKN